MKNSSIADRLPSRHETSKAYAIYCTMNQEQKEKFDEQYSLRENKRHSQIFPAIAIQIKNDKELPTLENCKEIESNYKEEYLSYLKNLPKDASEMETKNATKLLLEEYGINNTPHVYFMQGDTGSEKLPVQGWKFHVSTNDIRDYYEAVKTLIPEFIENKFIFKVVDPSFYRNENVDNLYGKAITIYPNQDFSLDKLSAEAKSFLAEPAEKIPNSDIPIEGRLNGRFGSFFYKDIIDEHGVVTEDSRDDSRYHDIDINRVLNFQSEIKKDLEEHEDLKRYVQEYTLGFQLNKGDEYMFSDFAFDKSVDLEPLKEYLENTIPSGNEIDNFLSVELFDKQILLVPDQFEVADDIKTAVKQYCEEQNIEYSHVQTNHSLNISSKEIEVTSLDDLVGESQKKENEEIEVTPLRDDGEIMIEPENHGAEDGRMEDKVLEEKEEEMEFE